MSYSSEFQRIVEEDAEGTSYFTQNYGEPPLWGWDYVLRG